MERSVINFGEKHKVPHLAEVVLDVYHAALKLSSRRTYNTGQKAYRLFMTSLSGGVWFPFHRLQLGETELNLAFFMAHLLLKPSIKVGSTILNYESHVKFWFRSEGCAEEEYATPFLRQVRAGIRKTLPSLPDERIALLLPSMIQRPEFHQCDEPTNLLFQFATIIGFIGMLRPHTFDQMNPGSFTIVAESGRQIQLRGAATRFKLQLNEVRRTERIIGFFITFDSKTMCRARAYLPSLCSRTQLTGYEAMCPVRALTRIAERRCIKKGFLKKINRGKKFAEYLGHISGVEGEYAPYALRIGGRT